MNILKMACLGLAVAGTSMIASAEPKLIPHRGAWKHYSNESAAENSVTSYERAEKQKVNGQYYADFIEIDIRLLKIATIHTPVVFHDKVFERLTNYNSDYDDWGKLNFSSSSSVQSTTNALTTNISTRSQFDDIDLRRMQKDGGSTLTNDELLTLKDFIDATVCKGGPKLILDLQDFETTRLSANVVSAGTCPDGTKKDGTSYKDLVYLKLFVGDTWPSVVDASDENAENAAQQIINFFGSSLTYIFQINSGQLDTACTSSPCRINPKLVSNRTVDSAKFLRGAMDEDKVFGIGLSVPREYPDDPNFMDTFFDTMEDLLDIAGTKNRDLSSPKKLISTASRPEGAIMHKAKALNGSAKDDSGNGKKTRCYPFFYDGAGGGIRFFGPTIHRARNHFAMSSSFDYIIADGYVRDGHMYFDIKRDLIEICDGMSKPIVTEYTLNSTDGNTVKTANYQNMKSASEYHWMDSIQNVDQIDDVFE